MKHHHAIAGDEPGDFRPNGDHRARSFVAEYPRGRMRTGRDFLEVGSANSAGMHFNQDFARGDLWNRNSFKANVIHAAVNRSQHG